MLSKDLKELKKISEISLKSQLVHLVGFFTLLLFSVIISFAVYFNASISVFIVVILCSFLILLSVLIVHIQYLLANKGHKICIDGSNRLIYYKEGKEIEVNAEDVLSVEKNISYNYYATRKLLPTDAYHYSKIVLKNNDIFIITSLLLPDFMSFPEKTHKKEKIIAMIT